MKAKSPALKLQGYLFLAIYCITFVRLAWLVLEGADPRPILFLMACCSVWFALIALMTAFVEKQMWKQKRERHERRW